MVEDGKLLADCNVKLFLKSLINKAVRDEFLNFFIYSSKLKRSFLEHIPVAHSEKLAMVDMFPEYLLSPSP